MKRCVKMILLLAAVLLCSVSWAQGNAINGEVSLTLPGAVTQVEKNVAGAKPTPAALLVELTCINGVWSPQAKLDYSRFVSARIATIPVTIEKNKISFSYAVNDDPWQKGGKGSLTLEVNAEGENAGGTFTGIWNDQPVEGKIAGTVFPFYDTFAAQLKFKPGQHPRLLGISNEELKRRAGTEWGKQYVDVARSFLSAKPEDLGTEALPYREEHRALGFALLYILDGKEEYLKWAKFWTYWCMNDRSGEAGAWANMARYQGVAYCFDLLYDQWSAQEKTQIIRFLSEDPRVQGFNVPAERFAGSYGMGFAVSALSGRLAIIGEPVEAPKVTLVKDVTNIAPLPAELVQPAGTPVTPLAHWRCPEAWLKYGLFPGEDVQAIIKDLGGLNGPLPVAGVEFTAGGVTNKVTLLDKSRTGQSLRYYPRGANPCLTILRNVNDLPKKYQYQPAWAVFTTLVDTDDRVMYAQPDYEVATYGTRLWVNDVEVTRDQVIHFAKGRYRLTCAAPMNGAQWVAPNFRNYDEAVALADAAESKALLAANLGTLPGQSRALLELRNWLAGSMPGFIGEKGAMTAALGRNDAWHALMPSLHSWQITTKMPFPSDGAELSYAWYLHSRGQVFSNDWGNTLWSTLGFPAQVPAEYRSLQRQTLDAYGKNAIGYGCVGQAIWLLVNYPADTEADIKDIEKLPRVLHDKRTGAYSLRTGWDLPTSLDALMQVQSRADFDGQFAGAWTVGGMNKYPNSTFLGGIPTPGGVFTLTSTTDEVTGIIPHIQGQSARGGGKVLSEVTAKDGSLILSMETGEYVPEPKGNTKAYNSAKPTGAKVVRHVAFDLSGSAGAPMVIAQLDRFSGVADNTPYWTTYPFGRGSGALDGKVYRWTGTKDGNANPPKVTMTALTGSLTGTAGLRHQGSNELWSVIVISQDTPPAVKIAGEGLDAVITIGKQTISFDKEKNKLVLGVFTPEM